MSIVYLYAIYQRTQSESKSQLWNKVTKTIFICTQSIKELNLKANHNFTLLPSIRPFLYAIYQRTQSESKSQPPHLLNNLPKLCTQSIKELNLKANHNTKAGCTTKRRFYHEHTKPQRNTNFTY